MTDITQPASAAEFIAAGADPVIAAGLAHQANIMAGRGTPEERAALPDLHLHNLPPPASPPPASAVSQQEGTAALQAHMDAALSNQMAADFAPPASPSDYRIPQPDNVSDEQFAADSQIRNDLHSARIPKFVVESIASNLDAYSRTSLTPQQEAVRLEENKLRLTKMWGDKTQSNLDIVDRFLEQATEKAPALKGLVVRIGQVFSPLDLDLLLQTASQQGKR